MNKNQIYKMNIPSSLKDLRQWLGYRIFNETRKDKSIKTNKIPISPITLKASDWNNKANWTDFGTALNGLSKSRYDGLSFVLVEDDPFVCIDIDNISKAEPEFVRGILRDFENTYKETSLSDNGIHIFTKGKLPKNINNREYGIEMYHTNKCIAMTGNIISDCVEVKECQDLLDSVDARLC